MEESGPSDTLEDSQIKTNSTTTSPVNSNLFIAKVVIQSIILALAIFGNSYLLFIMRKRKRNFTRMHIFIIHLCFADMMVAFFNILPQLIWEIIGIWIAGDVMCRIVKFMQIFVMYLSTYILVLTGLDRRRAICNPLTSHTWTFRLVHLSVGFVYILSAVLSTPQAIIFKYQETEIGSGTKNCWVHFYPEWTLQLYITSFTVLVYIIPLFILIYAYGSIYYTIIMRQKQSKTDNTVTSDTETERPFIRNGVVVKRLHISETIPHRFPNKTHVTETMVPRSNSFAGFTRAKLKTVKLTLVIILAYIACWSPFFISQLWWLYDETAPLNHNALVIMILLASLNSCCNPWIYMAFSGSFSLGTCPPSDSCCGNRKIQKSKNYTDGYVYNRNIIKRQSTTTSPFTMTPSTSKYALSNITVLERSGVVSDRA